MKKYTLASLFRSCVARLVNTHTRTRAHHSGLQPINSVSVYTS